MGGPAILVAVRKRPVMRHERDKGGVDVVQTEPGGVSLVVNEPKVRYDLTKYTEKHNYVFDRSFDESENNATVYREVVRPLLDTFFAAGNATCFAYGQTGSGKTHTMLGDRRRDKGIYLLAAEDIFRGISLQERSVFVSFYEIYGRKIFDLLNDKNRLVVREDGDKQINICGLSEHCVRSVDAVMRLMEEGSSNRSEGVTGANAESSRSHAVLRIEMRSAASNRSLGMLHFIDLAGNERGSDTRDCDRQTRIEGAEINKSLLALKECIRALGMGKSHVPFRGSVLTEVLRSSFIGNSRTTMIANISPSSTNCEHTLNTLRYTDRVKGLGKKDDKKGAGGRRPVAGRRMDPQPAAAAAAAPAAPRLKEMPAKQKNMGEDVMQIVRKLKGQIHTETPLYPDEDDDDEEDEEREVEKCYTHVAEKLQEAQDELVVQYRGMLDSRVQLMLKETEAIKTLDKGGVRDLDDFVRDIDGCLFANMQAINGMRDRLAVLKEQLRQEELLGRSFRPTFRP